MSALFTWIPSEAIRSLQPAVYSTKFGEGYEQNMPRGINAAPASWDVQFKCKPAGNTC